MSNPVESLPEPSLSCIFNPDILVSFAAGGLFFLSLLIECLFFFYLLFIYFL